MIRILRTLLVVTLAWKTSAATTSNDDSCDIGVAPAATLLLPYFEVDLDDPEGETTVFTITNVTNLDRIARVTLWTDYAVPVLTFNVQLTGYGVQSISLYDVIARGVIGPEKRAARGRYSEADLSSACTELPRTLPPEHAGYVQSALIEGIVTECRYVGRKHENAVGYATIDLVRNCSANDPLDERYWTEDLAFDNALIGDYQQISSAGGLAQGAPLVHIRAIPEGGTPAERMAHQNEHGANLTRTFYARYQPWYAPKLDSRQPLPSVFAARWISGGTSGFDSFLKIWREGKTGPGVTCATHDDNTTIVAERVAFDDAENAFAEVPRCRCTGYSTDLLLPATSLTRVRDASAYPFVSSGAVGGWMYLNLDNDARDHFASSNWVISSLRAEGRYSADIEAASLGNGCSAPAAQSEISSGLTTIGPRP